MARIQLLLCFTTLFATATLLNVISAHAKIETTLPHIEIPKTVKDVEPYTVNVVMVFVTNLEKECPKTSKFKAFFEKLRACAKYVCPLKRFTQKDDYDKDMKTKAGSLFQTISSFANGKIREEIQEEKMEAIETFRKMKSLTGRIMGDRKKDEDEDSMELTVEQQNAIKEGIMDWETVITKIANTMEQSTTNSTSVENTTTNEKETSSGTNKNSDSESSNFNSGSSFKDTIGSSYGLGSPSESPSSSKSSSSSTVEGKSETSFKDTTGGSSISPSGSPKTSSIGESSISPSGSPKTSSSGESSISPTTSSTSSAVECKSETSFKDTTSGSSISSSGSPKTFSIGESSISPSVSPKTSSSWESSISPNTVLPALLQVKVPLALLARIVP